MSVDPSQLALWELEGGAGEPEPRPMDLPEPGMPTFDSLSISVSYRGVPYIEQHMIQEGSSKQDYLDWLLTAYRSMKQNIQNAE